MVESCLRKFVFIETSLVPLPLLSVLEISTAVYWRMMHVLSECRSSSLSLLLSKVSLCESLFIFYFGGLAFVFLFKEADLMLALSQDHCCFMLFQ